MSYKSLHPIYLVRFTDNNLILFNYFELDKEMEQWTNIDFVIKFKKGLMLDIVKSKEVVDMFGTSYKNTVNFKNVLTIDNIERYKLSPTLQNKTTYLKEIYNGNQFDMNKLNNVVLIENEFIEDIDAFINIEKNKSKKKIPNFIWIILMLIILFICYYFYSNYYKTKN